MQAAYEWTFLLVVLFPGTVGAAAGLYLVIHVQTNQLARSIRIAIRVVACSVAAVCVAACLTAFGFWWWSFDAAESAAGVPPAVDQAISYGQAITAGGLLVLMTTAAGSLIASRPSLRPSSTR